VSVQLVVFDMAGTTVHDADAVHACLLGALSAQGFEVGRKRVNEVMGLAKPVALRTIMEQSLGHPVQPERVDAAYQDFLRKMIAFYRNHPSVREIHPATDVFRELRRRGIRVALDTGFARAIVDAILERLGWKEGLLDATVASDEVERGRPHPDLIFRAMALTGVTDAGRVAKVGDTPADLAEGTAAGCGLVIGVTEGSHREEELESHPHTHLIASIAELPALLSRVSAEGILDANPGNRLP
jgi:phosphonatase-like hydrolase